MAQTEKQTARGKFLGVMEPQVGLQRKDHLEQLAPASLCSGLWYAWRVGLGYI